MGGKGGGAPDPIDPSQSAGEFLFGQNFNTYGGITDPRLQNRLLQAEQTYRPQYSALDLQNQEQFLFGVPSGQQNEAYRDLQREISVLERQLAQTPSQIQTQEAQRGSRSNPRGGRAAVYEDNPGYADLQQQLDQRRSELASMDSGGGPAQAGLLDILSRATPEISQIQSDASSVQRSRDIADVNRLLPEVMQAQRAANPEQYALYDTMMDRANARLGEANSARAQGYHELQRGLEFDQMADDANHAAGQLRWHAMQDRDAAGQLRWHAMQDRDAAGQLRWHAMQDREAADLLQGEALRGRAAAGSMRGYAGEARSRAGEHRARMGEEFARADEGFQIVDDERDAANALRAQAAERLARGGDLTPEERRLAQQSAREGAAARGRGLDNSALFGEALNRLEYRDAREERNFDLSDRLLGQAGTYLAEADRANARANQAHMRGGDAFGRAASEEQIALANEDRGLAYGNQALANEGTAQGYRNLALGSEGAAQNWRSQALANEGAAQNWRSQALANEQTAQGFGSLANEHQRVGQGQRQLNMAYTNLANQADTFGQSMIAQGEMVNADPFLTILGRPSGASQMAQGQQLLGNQMMNNLGPALFDPNVGINVGMANAANQTNYAAAQAGAQGSMMGGLFQGLGSIGQGMATAGIFPSDRRLKRDIVRIGTHQLDIGIYAYRYKGQEGRHIGVMAQELLKVLPEAVHERGGYLAVDYSQL